MANINLEEKTCFLDICQDREPVVYTDEPEERIHVFLYSRENSSFVWSNLYSNKKYFVIYEFPGIDIEKLNAKYSTNTSSFNPDLITSHIDKRIYHYVHKRKDEIDLIAYLEWHLSPYFKGKARNSTPSAKNSAHQS